MIEKLSFFSYLLKSYALNQPDTCPYCGSKKNKVIGTRRMIIQLKKCNDCGLMFRYPKEDPSYNQTYYQKKYTEGITTQVPDHATLQEWKKRGFKNTPRDFSEKIAITKMALPSGKLLDFGASWGYASYQFSQAGYEVTGFELSKFRAEYGAKNLDIPMITSYDEIKAKHECFDVIFTSHVVEHVPYPKDLFNLFAQLLKPNGKLVLFVPNCNTMSRIITIGFGMHHILALEKTFFQTSLPQHGFNHLFFASNPYHLDSLSKKYNLGESIRELDGDELLLIATKSK